MNYGIQMFSIRDMAEHNYENALRIAAEAGYKSIELAGTFGNSAKNVRLWLERYGLECFCAHVGKNMLVEDFDSTVGYYKELGVEYIVIPTLPMRNQLELDSAIELINYFQKKLETEGMRLAYHNHDMEYIQYDNGSYAHKELEQRTSVDFELDTFWTLCGGFDPIVEMQRLRDRIKFIHLKDGFVDARLSTAIGLGKMPIRDIRAMAIKLGFEIIIESEGLQPDGASEIIQCMQHLRLLELKEVQK